jgi:hypothetical protein
MAVTSSGNKGRYFKLIRFLHGHFKCVKLTLRLQFHFKKFYAGRKYTRNKNIVNDAIYNILFADASYNFLSIKPWNFSEVNFCRKG